AAGFHNDTVLSQVWDLSHPEKEAILHEFPLEARYGWPMAFSPNLAVAAIRSRAEGAIQYSGSPVIVENQIKGREVARFEMPGSNDIIGGTFAAQGALFLELSSSRVVMWD